MVGGGLVLPNGLSFGSVWVDVISVNDLIKTAAEIPAFGFDPFYKSVGKVIHRHLRRHFHATADLYFFAHKGYLLSKYGYAIGGNKIKMMDILLRRFADSYVGSMCFVVEIQY